MSTSTPVSKKTHPARPATVAPQLKPTAPLVNRTNPPDPGTTTPFSQKSLDAVKAGSGCWVWSGVLNEWIFVVRDEERKDKAVSRGINPGCTWTLVEITGVQGMSPEGLRDLAKAKHQFGGAIARGAKPERWRDALSPLEPAVPTLKTTTEAKNPEGV